MHPLDNVIWRALTTRQVHLGQHHGAASRFLADVSPLGGIATIDAAGYADLERLLAPGDRVGLFLDVAEPTALLAVVSSAPLVQMIFEPDVAPDAPAAPDAIAMTAADVPDMLALTQLTKPGPFSTRTHEMGEYLGIHRGGALIAMAGERLRVPGFTEISAVCTHPDHLGQHHAASLMTMVIRRILARDERPFLHVRADNARAIGLYERLGFRRRIGGNYVTLERTASAE